MDEITMLDFQNVLYLKNQLINIEINELLEIYKDYDNYIAFLDTVALLTNIDPIFLFISDVFIDKILKVIQIHRFSSKEISEAVNGTIEYMNVVRNLDKSFKQFLLTNYVVYHEGVRKKKFPDLRYLVNSFSYDAIVYISLNDGKMDRLKEKDLYISSFNYLTNTIPDLFEKSVIKKRAYDKLMELKSKNTAFNKIKRLLKLKEE